MSAHARIVMRMYKTKIIMNFAGHKFRGIPEEAKALMLGPACSLTWQFLNFPSPSKLRRYLFRSFKVLPRRPTDSRELHVWNNFRCA